MYGTDRAAASPGIGAFPSHDVNAHKPPVSTPPGAPAPVRNVSFQPSDAGVAAALGASADPTVSQAVAAVRASLRQRGAHGALGLEAAFRTCRQQQSGTIGMRRATYAPKANALLDDSNEMFANETRWSAGAVQLIDALKQVRGIDEQHVITLFRFLDTGNRGVLAVDELASCIYGPLSASQTALVRRAFQVTFHSAFLGCRCSSVWHRG